MMNSADVLEALDALRGEGVEFWLDGGWGVDALLGKQTRDQDDLDVVVDRNLLDRAANALAAVGYEHDRQAEPGLPARLALRDERSRRVDLHPVVLDDEGNGWQPLGDRAWGAYPAEGLAGRGMIDGRQVRCTTPQLQLRHHMGYSWNDTDRHDMELLAERFKIALPPHTAGV